MLGILIGILVGFVAIGISLIQIKMKNLKDTITTICGIVILASGTIMALNQGGVTVPAWLSSAGLAGGIIAGSILAYFTGKNPDGSTKSAEQVEKQNAQSKI